MKRSPVRILAATLATLVCAAAPAPAQIDIAGEWQSRIHEDQPHRGPGAELGDYTGLQINAAVRQGGGFRFETVDEVVGHQRGYVPHYPLGTKQDGFAIHRGLPFEATQGGKETTYPEYEIKVKRCSPTWRSGDTNSQRCK